MNENEMIKKDLSEFSDVLANDIQIEQVTGLEFEFDGFIVRREMHHWEIQFEDAEGEQGVVIEREDFVDGKMEFEVDSKKLCLALEEFDNIEKFAYDNKLI